MSVPLRLLVIDDERISRLTTVQQLTSAGLVATAAADGPAGLAELEAQPYDVVLTDLRMPGMDGLEVLREIKHRAPDVAVIIMTAYGSVETAVAAMQGGAADYLTKPFRFVELKIRLDRLIEGRTSRRELRRLRGLLEAAPSMHGLVGRSAAMMAVQERLRLAGDSAVPVLVTGETGTGKEVVARVLHDLGERRGGPFVALACGAIPRDLAEAQLFGHEKGAYTGADRRRPGCFERAHGGTLLLDDIDDLSQEVQAKLIRVLQEGAIVRVGGEQLVRTDVRVIATTKVDLAAEVAARRFRDDLYYRLRGLEIALPPLRNRGDDVMLLTHHFLRVVARPPDSKLKFLHPEVAGILRAHTWPGNVRELRRMIESAVALCPGDTILPIHLPAAVVPRPATTDLFSLHLDGIDQVELADLVRAFERSVIDWAMQRADGQQTRAAEILGLPRTSLQSKLSRRGE